MSGNFLSKPHFDSRSPKPETRILRPDRRRPRRRGSAAVADVVSSTASVVIGRRQTVGLARLVLSLEQTLQERPTPAAARAGAEALGQLADPLRPFDADEILDLPLGDVKAEAKLVVRFHVRIPI
jgi:hypothetical protein